VNHRGFSRLFFASGLTGLQPRANRIVPTTAHPEQVTLGQGYLKKPFTVRDGYIDVPTGPGLGIELDENALAGKVGHDWRNRELYDADDGSVVGRSSPAEPSRTQDVAMPEQATPGLAVRIVQELLQTCRQLGR